MKLSEALTRLKNIKSKLARVRGFITKSIVHYENETPEYNFVNELESYETLKKEILDLKTRKSPHCQNAYYCRGGQNPFC